MGTKVSEKDVDRAIDDMLEQIEAHELASSKVPQETTLGFYRGLVERLSDRIETLENEIG